MRALRKLRRDYPKDAYIFVSERGGPISPVGFQRLIQRLGEVAKMPFPIHPHMLRHACGFKLANDGHDPALYSTTSGTRTSSTRSDTPTWRPTGSRIFGGANDDQALDAKQNCAASPMDRAMSALGGSGRAAPRRKSEFDPGCVKTHTSVKCEK